MHLLSNVTKAYEWGSLAAIPSFLRRAANGNPVAELWMGTHPQAPSSVEEAVGRLTPSLPFQVICRSSRRSSNTNGLLRQCFPKSTDLSLFAPDYFEHVARKLNRRPRKRLKFRTPAEALDKLLSEPFNPNDVASTA
ncbi:MAG TPA: type I phosphomannose isomerase catalytic subunit [Aeromicrobium sp.]|nr:type I phosphomannose isomerase catalytic subunit [Aeromicrobium sp.]